MSSKELGLIDISEIAGNLSAEAGVSVDADQYKSSNKLGALMDILLSMHSLSLF
jgi:hypothetical protein